MSLDVQEAFEGNSVAAEQRYMRSIHAGSSRRKTHSSAVSESNEKQQPEQLCSVVYDIRSRQRVHILPRPVYSVSLDGRKAVSFDFGRLDVVQAGELLLEVK